MFAEIKAFRSYYFCLLLLSDVHKFNRLEIYYFHLSLFAFYKANFVLVSSAQLLVKFNWISFLKFSIRISDCLGL